MRGAEIIRKVVMFLCGAIVASAVPSVLVLAAPNETADANGRASRGDTLVVGLPSDRCPLLYVDHDTGEFAGVGVDLMREVAEDAGYEVVFESIGDANLKDALDNGAYDVVMPFASAIESSSGKRSIVSDDLFQTPFTLVTKGSETPLPAMGDMRIGMLASLRGVAETVNELYPDVQIKFYDTLDDAVSELRMGDVDALLYNSYIWSYILQKPTYSDLAVRPASMFTMGFKVGTLDTPEGKKTIERLNEGIGKLSDTQRQALILDYTTRKLYRYDLSDYVYHYWPSVAAVAAIGIVFVIFSKQRYRLLTLEKEKEMRHALDHDSLTGTLSLDGFRRRATELLLLNPHAPYMVSYSNIRNFKYVNDTLGRETGDALLQFWAEKTQEQLSDDDALGRVDGDHIVALHHIVKEDRESRNDKRFFDAVRDYLIDHGGSTQLQVCSGIYLLTPEDYQDINIDRFIDYAREAEQRIRREQGDGYGFYNPDQWEKGRRATEIVGHLQIALREAEIEVWYQPQVSFSTGHVIGAEALCRWHHSTLGWISPGEFIPMLEEAGLIRDLDRYVWAKVCEDLGRWNRQGIQRTVSVNLSRHDIRPEENAASYLYNLVRSNGVDPTQLRIEITETAYVEFQDVLVRTTEELRALGFQVEMDDFGSGYSSLNMLKEVPVDRIKLDLRFLDGEGDPEHGRVIISYVIQMAQALGKGLIAEGVENALQAKFLYEHGCDEMQGYHFHKPMPVSKFEGLEEREAEAEPTA